MRGMNAWACVDTDSKREFVAVSAVCPVNPTVVLVTIVTTSHVIILLVTHVPTGQDGQNGDNVQPHVVLASEENKELATEKISKKVKFGIFNFRQFENFREFNFLIFEFGFPVGDKNRIFADDSSCVHN